MLPCRILNKSAAIGFGCLLFLLFVVGNAAAQKIVLMPMADLSKGENGINLGFTKAVETSLKQLGVELVSRSDVKLFMARNKVRTYRYLDSYLVKKIGAEFEVPLVVIGTIAELQEEEPTIGITFTALDTTDGAPVWAASVATSAQEQVRMLGIGEPKTVIELVRPLLKETLQPLVKLAYQAEASESRDYQLLGFHLSPGYVQGGQVVGANLKVKFLGQRPTLIAAESEAGKSYLQYDRQTDSYVGEWFAPRENGTYKVDLRFEWGRERTVERITSVASFEVINRPPGLTMEIKKGVKIGQRLAFRDHLLILPRLDNLRPMAGWALEIKRADGEPEVYEEHEGDLPERMVWEGRGSDGAKLANGVYDLTLEVWDLAGNRSSDSQRVVLQSSTPKVKGRITYSGGKAHLNLAAGGLFEFPLTSWQADLRSMKGQLLTRGEGKQLPAQLEFTPIAGEIEAYLSVSGEDLLGNRLRITRQKIRLVEVDEQVEEQKVKSWVPDF
ncbi:hypothetical protein [Malonomonas rubra]|uniref:hypothetical protein n=1 Tax=Malonomonas rubra TaxID=57040 RepID=UPI0026F0E66F|nr:hypothetical protein [Malonomonas rubra]